MFALLPSLGIGMRPRGYVVNFMIFGAWGLLYGVFCRLAVALNIKSMAAITGGGDPGGMLAGATSEVLPAAASILFSVCILLIPFLAKRTVEGDLGSTMLAVVGTTAALAQSAAAIAAGPGGGYGQTSSALGGGDGGGNSAAAGSSNTPPSGPSSATSGSGAGSPTGSTAGTGSGGQAPSGPHHAGHGIRDYRPINIPHAVG